MKFDVVIMNPPYGEKEQLYVDFINKTLTICDKVISINPEIALLDKNPIKNKNKLLKNNINKYKPKLYISKWDDFETAMPNSRCCINYWDINNTNDIIVEFNSKTYNFKKQEEIRLTPSKYYDEFFNKLTYYIKYHNSIYDVMFENPKNNQYFCKKGKEKIVQNIDKDKYYMYFPYIIASHYTTYGYEKYSDYTFNGAARVFVLFNTLDEAHNMYKTICVENGKRGELTEFYNLVLSLIKNNYISAIDRYDYFPMFDFSKSYTTEELFKMIGMEYNKEEIDKILYI